LFIDESRCRRVTMKGGKKEACLLFDRQERCTAKSSRAESRQVYELRVRAARAGNASNSSIRRGRVRSLTLPLAAAISRTLQIEWRLLDTRLIPLKTSNGQKLHQQPPSILRAAVLTCLHGRQASPSHMHSHVHIHTHTERLSSVFVSGSRQFAPMLSRSLSLSLSLSLCLSLSLYFPLFLSSCETSAKRA